MKMTMTVACALTWGLLVAGAVLGEDLAGRPVLQPRNAALAPRAAASQVVAPGTVRESSVVTELSESVQATGKRVATAQAVTQANQAQNQPQPTLPNAIQVQPQVSSSAPSTPAPSGTEQAFADGKLFYNAVPAMPAANSSAIKVIDSQRDIDYICRVYQIKTPGAAAEIGSFVRRLVEKADGAVNVSVNVKTGEEQIAVIGPAYQFPYVEELVAALDKPGVSYNSDGTITAVYPMRNRLATQLALVAAVLKSPDGTLMADNAVNKAVYIDDPSYMEANIKYFSEFDVPPPMVRIEAQILEVQDSDDFNFGLALEAWKEGLPDTVDLKMDFQQAGNVQGLLQSRPEYTAQSVYLKGMHPKAVANMINYLVRTGHAKILSRPTVVAMNDQEAVIESMETIDYNAYTPDNSRDQAYPLAKQTASGEVGVSLRIKPAIGTETLTLNIMANVSSVVGWSTAGEPIVDRRSTTATAVLQDGEMFSLSGLRKDTITKMDERVPILGYTPLIGYLFRHEVDVKKTSEIVILLTPYRVTASTGIINREKEIVNEANAQMTAPPPGALETFVDRVILNKK